MKAPTLPESPEPLPVKISLTNVNVLDVKSATQSSEPLVASDKLKNALLAFHANKVAESLMLDKRVNVAPFVEYKPLPLAFVAAK
jgi:hypothetical protein